MNFPPAKMVLGFFPFLSKFMARSIVFAICCFLWCFLIFPPPTMCAHTCVSFLQLNFNSAPQSRTNCVRWSLPPSNLPRDHFSWTTTENSPQLPRRQSDNECCWSMCQTHFASLSNDFYQLFYTSYSAKDNKSYFLYTQCQIKFNFWTTAATLI